MRKPFEEALETAEVIEETALNAGELKELLLLVEWVRPLHVVVVVDDVDLEERIVTVLNQIRINGTGVTV